MASQFEIFDGGCQCSLVRYRVTLPRDTLKFIVCGKKYPTVNHCCPTCFRISSTLTQTSLNIPTSCIQFASRVPYTSEAVNHQAPPTSPQPSSSHVQQKLDDLPPYGTMSAGTSSGRSSRRLSTSSAASSSTVTTAVTSSPTFSVTNSTVSSTAAPPLRNDTSFMHVGTPIGLCALQPPSPNASPAAPAIPRLLIAPPRPAYYSPLAADARRNPYSARRTSGPSPSSSQRVGGVTPPIATASQAGSGVENSFLSPTSTLGDIEKKEAAPLTIGETISPLAAVTPHVQKQKPSSPSPTSEALEPPYYPPLRQQQSQPGICITPNLTIPWPYKEFPLSNEVLRGFCGYCGSGLLVRRSPSSNKEEAIMALAIGSLDYPEKILAVEGIFDKEANGCILGDLDEEALKLFEDWGVQLGEGERSGTGENHDRD